MNEIKPYYPKTTIKEFYKPCVTLYHQMIIRWSGDVFACDVVYNHDADYYCGILNVDGASIYAMYHSENSAKLRALTQTLQHKDLSLCRDCYQTTYKYEDLKKKQSIEGA